MSDTAPIRPEERFDEDRVAEYLQDQLSDLVGDHPIRFDQFPGGAANLTYRATAGDTELVLRRAPLGSVASGGHDMAREFRVLSRLWREFPKAPRAYHFCEDETVMGKPFFVMERRHGWVIRNAWPPGFESRPGVRRHLAEELVAALAELHRIDPDAVDLGDLGRPDGFVERQVDGWQRRWEAAKTRDVPAMSAAVTILHERRPGPQAATLLHNDYKLDNMMVGAEDPARAVAVFDWDMCTRGDPLMDLGYLLTFWGEAGDDTAWIMGASMPTWHDGFPTRDQAVARYARATGIDCDTVHWYHVFGVFKIAVVLQQIYIRYLRGQTQDERFAVFGKRVAALINKAATLARV